MTDFFEDAVRDVLGIEQPRAAQREVAEVTVARVPWTSRQLRFWDLPEHLWRRELEERRRKAAE